MKRTSTIVHIYCAVIFVFLFAGCAIPESGISYPYGNLIERVNLGLAGIESNSSSGNPSISADGRYVAFESSATNLVAGDPDVGIDVFVYDRQSDTVQAVKPAGIIWPDGNSYNPSISADGRYVAFNSKARNLVTPDTGLFDDIFVYDRQSDTIKRASESSEGIQANNSCFNTSISADGQYVAFESDATNLVSGDTNGCTDIFVHDCLANTTVRVTSSGVEGDGNSSNSMISAEGRYIAFESNATNLVSGDTNAFADIFVYDLVTGTVERVSVSSSGEQAEQGSLRPSISADGRYIAFQTAAENLVTPDTGGWDILVYDRQSDTIERASESGAGIKADSSCMNPSISGNGRYVAFQGLAANLVPGDTNNSNDIFVRDLQAHTTVRVSVSTGGTQGDAGSTLPVLSADGIYVVFPSPATNLVTGDLNGTSDIFAAPAR